MESILLWWNLELNPRYTVYSSQLPNTRVCMAAIRELTHGLPNQMLGHFDAKTHTCRIIVWPEDRNK